MNTEVSSMQWLRRLLSAPGNVLYEAEKRYYDRWEVVAFCTIGMLATVCFGIFTLWRGEYPLGVVLLVAAAAQGLVLWLDLHQRTSQLARWLCVITLTTLFFYLFIGGGYNGSGPVWCVGFGPLFVSLLNDRIGGFYFLGLILAMLALIVSPVLGSSGIEHQLTDPGLYRNRVVMVLALAGGYVWLQEYSRHRMMERLMASQQVMEALASTDPLTGLANRRAMEQQLDSQERRSRSNLEQYGLVVADIDYFKRINDTHGHHCGDRVIARIAEIMREHLREQDVVARWGGEEFLILLPQTDLQGALDASEKLRRVIEQANIATDRGWLKVTMSFGVAVGDHSVNIDECLKGADRALYLAKEQGRNHVCFV